MKARFDSLTGEGVTNVYDGFGHHISSTLAMDSKSWPLTYQYDANGNRTRITHPDSAYFTSSFDGLDRLDLIENSSGQDLVAPAWNTRGLLAGVTRISSAHDQGYSYDNAGRLSGLEFEGGQSSSEVAWSVTRNAASQVLTSVRDNDDYAWGGQITVTRAYEVNGLNQYTEAGSAEFCSDANGNLIWDGTYVYIYDAENRLVEKRQDNNDCPDADNDYTGSLIASLRYDPLGRLYEYYTSGAGGGTTRFLYDGDALVGEYSTSGGTTGTLLRRYVHGSDAGADDPLLWFEGASTTSASARHLYADRLGSIVLVGSNTGSALEINAYDEYGIPDAQNEGGFQYTGQIWLKSLDMYYYKARIYSPYLGRFLQSDPVGYDDQVNLYAYVGNDPVNGTDPTGKISRLPREGPQIECRFTACEDVRRPWVPQYGEEGSNRGIGDNGGPPLDGDSLLKQAAKVGARLLSKAGGVVSLLWSEPAGAGSDRPRVAYTNHARQRMQKRGVSEQRVEEARQKGSRTLQENGNYRYDLASANSASGRGLTVVVNYQKGLRIITVMDRGSKFVPK